MPSICALSGLAGHQLPHPLEMRGHAPAPGRPSHAGRRAFAPDSMTPSERCCLALSIAPFAAAVAGAVSTSVVCSATTLEQAAQRRASATSGSAAPRWSARQSCDRTRTAGRRGTRPTRGCSPSRRGSVTADDQRSGAGERRHDALPPDPGLPRQRFTSSARPFRRDLLEHVARVQRRHRRRASARRSSRRNTLSTPSPAADRARSPCPVSSA